MDHEFDRTASEDDTTTGSDDQGTAGSGQPLEQPPNGPSAAHFREAARLAAARARKAIREETSPGSKPPTPDSGNPGIDETTFSEAARTRAMNISGREPEPIPSTPTEPEGRESDSQESTAGKSRGERKREVRKEISQLDERLMLGARMLRAFESQIQRLDAAAREAETPSSLPAPQQDTATEDAIISRAEEVIQRLEEHTRKAEETAESLANGIEISSALEGGTRSHEETVRNTEQELQQRADEIHARASDALQRMEASLRRVMEIERAVVARVDQAIGRLEQTLNAPTPVEDTSETTPEEKASPLIEVEPLQGRVPEASEPTPAPARPEGPSDDEKSSLSVGTLSIDPTLGARRREGAS